ncbi:MAG TPA: flagellar protein [Bdellovibrionales bacterium]|nr:MAG: flagellar protein [Bdellovibrionales bacterium GWB1_52_6]OFZ02643.1 MAG: flagellar protein [Bdellovibrionales bacterium GWA1_52_35]OFZ38146.1 MAG: flagellar protein [Bdellovibrionales bacterium GWC1_52_8]HAR43242.1 flagellar protein [Bdellovibrionales bacterium]HCM41508.1 flagellar protein [Bdellovibrionales bacterium]
MIKVSRLNGKEFVLNCDMIKTVEATPDTVITLLSGEKTMVRESVDDVIRATMEYKRKIFFGPPERQASQNSQGGES